ncbi:MAG: oligosaccharyl transferase, archaeosortase A system-associated [Methanotrichaceae archaeon]|nr:oligosaccharyl transferase, archaeosortase A system-associated [Methanotrichaceae archaeon]
MSKRSANKRDNDNKAGEKPPQPAKAAASPATPQQAASSTGSSAWIENSDIYWYAGVVLAALFSFYLRAIIPWNRVFVGDRVIFSSETDAWYHMMLAKGTVLNLQRLWFDPMTYFPNGTPTHFGPFVSWAITIPSYIAGLGSPSMHTVEVVGALLPAVLGALLVFPVYFIGRELGGKSCGLISALIVAVIPGQLFSRTTLGFTDHHAAEILLSTVFILFMLLALRTGRTMTFAALQKSWSDYKIPLAYSALAGIFLGLYIDAWSSGFLFEGIILAFVLIQSVVDHLKGRSVEYLGISSSIAFFVAMLLVLPFVKSYNGFSNYFYSFFHPTILLLGVVAALFMVILSKTIREKGLSSYYYPGALAAVVVAGLIILAVALPQFFNPLFAGLNIFQPKSGGAATVGEASPLLFYQGEFTLSSVQSNFPGIMVILSPFFLSIIGLALLLYRYARKMEASDLLVVIWSVIMLLLTVAQNRFAYYYGVNVAILCGLLAYWVLQKAGFGDMESGLQNAKEPGKFLLSNLKVLAAAVLIFLILIYPGLSTSVILGNYVSGPDSDWLTSTAWLENNTPSPGLELYKIYERPANGRFDYPDEAYGIMSWWDFGHLIETIGHRMPNANPFQQGIGNASAGTPGSSPFFLSQTEQEAEDVLAAIDSDRSLYNNTKYVMIDWDMATGKFYAMTAWSVIPITKYYGIFYQIQGDQLVPVQVYRDPFFQTMTARLFFFDGSEVPVTDAYAIAYQLVEQNGMTLPVIIEAPKISSDYNELLDYVNESRNSGYLSEVVASVKPTSIATSVPLEALQHYRLVHESESTVTYDGQKFVKTFEHVPGAVIKGNAAPGTEVVIVLPVKTNQDRTFVYRQSNVTDASGEFTLVVPYSTEGPIAEGTNFDTAPMGPYQLAVDNSGYEIRVPEEYVLQGGVIQV